MIELTKLQIPEILKTKGQLWTVELMQYVNNNQDIPAHITGRYRHEEIKEKVKLETKEKCAYCESNVTHQYPGDVEHLIPKSIFRRLTFTWYNLSFVCYWCNNNKRDYVDKTCKILNPYKDCIESHIQAFGPLLMHINQSKRGELTLKEIKLNRIKLIERRTEALENLQNLIDKFEGETSPALKSVLKQILIEQTQAESEFSFIKKQYLKDRCII